MTIESPVQSPTLMGLDDELPDTVIILRFADERASRGYLYACMEVTDVGSCLMCFVTRDVADAVLVPTDALASKGEFPVLAFDEARRVAQEETRTVALLIVVNQSGLAKTHYVR